MHTMGTLRALVSLDGWGPALRRTWLAALALHVAAAVFSSGYHHPDEHFQILELVRFKLEGGAPGELAWEHGAALRPWLQPWMYYGVVRGLEAIGVADRFAQALVLRLLSALAGWLGLVLFARACLVWFGGERQRWWLVAGLSFSWFLPYLHARTSSENLSTTFFWTGLSLLVLAAHRPPAMARRWVDGAGWLVGAGGVLGLAFHLRYQVGIMIGGALLWLVLERRWRALAWASAGLAVALCVGVLVDRWGYGEWQLAAWNYLRVNLVEDKASQFGVRPWWWYLHKVSMEAPPPLGLFLLVAVSFAWLRRPLHPLTLTTLPFFVVHCAIAHKELRFLFPMGQAAVPLALLALEAAPALARWVGRVPKRLARAALVAALLPNFAYLLLNVVRPTRSETLLLHHLYARDAQRLELFTLGHSPYEYKGIAFRFYAPRQVSVRRVASYDAFLSELRGRGERLLFYVPANWLPDDAAALRDVCEVSYRTYPEWVRDYDVKGWLARSYQGMVLECRVTRGVR